MNAPAQRARATEGFFGRRHGKAMTALQSGALALGMERYRIDLATPAPTNLAGLFVGDVSSVCLEIGFGGGEHLVHAAAHHPETGFIGVEPFVNGMAKLMAALAPSPSANLRVYDDDAIRVLDWAPAASIDRVDLFYPDPWPKKRHWKRRFVSPVNLDRIARVLKPGGLFRFASDIDSYVNWTLLLCRDHKAFEWIAEDARDWHRPYDDWVRTRYEAKAIREGRRAAYLHFGRRQSTDGQAPAAMP